MNHGFYPPTLLPSTTVGGCIDIFENAWVNYKETIEKVEAEVAISDNGIAWQRSTTVGQGHYQDARTNLDMGITYYVETTNNSVMREIQNQYFYLLMSTVPGYTRRYNVNEGFWWENFNLLKYRSGEEYKPHYDGGTPSHRHISAICYLNDDYEGGEIEFNYHKIKIKPEPGMLILFPSNYAYTHTAHPVKSGTKYALVTWLHDQPI
jgi:Rps23 Pro-64 3,4-dihydroxylase Tpa1-like proline 4-hydroxylase